MTGVNTNSNHFREINGVPPIKPPRVDPSDRKFFSQAVDRGVEGASDALRAFDRTYVQQNSQPTTPAAPSSSATTTPPVVDPSDRKFYSRAVDIGTPSAEEALRNFDQALADRRKEEARRATFLATPIGPVDASDRKFYTRAVDLGIPDAELALQRFDAAYIAQAPEPQEHGPDPAETASDIIRANTTTRNQRSGDPKHTIHFDDIAADIVQLARENPELAGAVYTEAALTVDPDRLQEAVDEALLQEHTADAMLLGDATPEAIDPATASAKADEIIEGATRTQTIRQNTRTMFDINEAAYDLETLAEENPSLAVAVRAEMSERLNADQNADLNRIVSGNATIGENVDIALSHPGEAPSGIFKQFVNGLSGLGELFVRGSTMQAAGQQYEAAGYSALFGNDELAEEQMALGDELMETAQTTDFIPEMSIDNRAEAGWGTIGIAIEVAMAGKGIITGGARLLARNADELAALGARNGDELVGAGASTADDLAAIGARTASQSDVAAIRVRNGLSDADTVAAGRTDIPGLTDEIFEGMSPSVRNEADLPSLDELYGVDRPIQSPRNNALFTRHAEEDVLNSIATEIDALDLPDGALDGRRVTIAISNDSGVCNACRQGLNNPDVAPGVIKQFSERYPDLTIEIIADGQDPLIVRGGTTID